MLEGIALVGDPDFAIVDEAFPFISKRLMTDDSPRLREALRYMVRPLSCWLVCHLCCPCWLVASWQFGHAVAAIMQPPLCPPLPSFPSFPSPQVYGKDTAFDADRLIDLLAAFETYSEASQSARGNMDTPQGGQATAPQGLAAAAAMGRTSTFPDGSSGAPSTSGRLPGGFPGFPGGFPGLPGSSGGMAGPFGPAGQLASALNGMVTAPLLALSPVAALPAPGGSSLDMSDNRNREALRCGRS